MRRQQSGILLRLAKTAVLLLFIGMGSLFIFLPNMGALIVQDPVKTSFMSRYEERTGKEAKLAWVYENQISNHLKKAVLAAEDDTFFDHEGFNWQEIKKAAAFNWKKRSFKRGASTLTQQLVKNLYLGPQKNIFRKLREAILTYQMEMTLSKNRILELYLNVVEWGPGIFGAEAASQYYFKKSAVALNSQEAAFLAAILPSPIKWGASPGSRYVKKRTNLIVYRMKYVRLAPQEIKPIRDKTALTEAFSEKAEAFLKRPQESIPQVDNPGEIKSEDETNEETEELPAAEEMIIPEY